MKTYKTYICVGIALVLIAASFFIFQRKSVQREHQKNVTFLEAIALSDMNKGLPRLLLQDSKEGTGDKEASMGSHVRIDYTVRINGKVVDQTLGKKPIEFTIGKHETIEGLEFGVMGMKLNGRRFITIPPHHAYGSQGAGSGLIPPNATLNYEVELIEFK